ncbi:MAG: ATP-dependent helicase, partial [Acidobacteria bacterium]|nr:ATP-dependent helicase [Acidobacteriota bacterium]
LAGEFQRIAVSATVRPMERVAAYVGGFRLEKSTAEPTCVPRSVACIRAESEKKYDIRIETPAEKPEFESSESFWTPIVDKIRGIIHNNRSTLIFTNSRRLCERLTLKINADSDPPVAYSHHGSLSKELRLAVEDRLKAGELRAIVATNSLELGIDIGTLDEVILVQSPPSVSSAVQRIGRAGHSVGETSRGRIYPTHDMDFLQSAVLARAVNQGDIEEARPVDNPLDVLSQIIISMTAMETWDRDDLFTQLRTSYPYRELPRRQYDLVLDMLSGRFARTKIRELRPRISIDRLDNTVAAKKSALLQLYISGGTIPDRGYFHLRHAATNDRIGELDEEFVWEAKIGQRFNFGTQHWKITRFTHNDVFVLPVAPREMDAPFWKGEAFDRDFHFSEKILHFFEEADSRLGDPEYAARLQKRFFMDREAAERLAAFLKKQKDETACALPHRHHILVEHIRTGPGGVPGHQTVVHTFWGGRVNRPLAMALDAAWEKRFGHRLEIYAGNDSIVLQLAEAVSGEELLTLVSAADLEERLRERLEGSGYFGARFRESAGRALLLTKSRINERMPLWMSRMRAQKLMQAVSKTRNFPILLEAWRSCLQDDFEMDALRGLLSELENGTIRVSECFTSRPSPFSRTLSWQQINQYMYAGDALQSDSPTRLQSDLLHEITRTPGLRPSVSPDIVRRFENKRQRLHPGYSPGSARDLVDWIKERRLLPLGEWAVLLDAVRSDHKKADEWLEAAGEKLRRLHLGENNVPFLIAAEDIRALHRTLSPEGDVHFYTFNGDSPVSTDSIPPDRDIEEHEEDLLSFLAGWLQFYGPRETEWISRTLGLPPERLTPVLDDLLETETLITGQLIADDRRVYVCDADNYEALLRISRSAASPAFEPREAEELALFLADFQGLTERRPTDDALLSEGEIRWLGSGRQRVTFYFESDIDLLPGRIGIKSPPRNADYEKEMIPPHDLSEEKRFFSLFSDLRARYSFEGLIKNAERSPHELADHLWKGVWEGTVGNDTFFSLRSGLLSGFSIDPETKAASARSVHRTGRMTVRSRPRSTPFSGTWHLIPAEDQVRDPIALEERKKDRVRPLLERYGLLFRELLLRESVPFQWKSLFRTLRIMELSGEVLAGYFFKGIPGLQFMSERAFRRLRNFQPSSSVFWLNAADPASLCGIPLESLRHSLPHRVDSAHIVYRGTTPVLISRGTGRHLEFSVSPDDRDMARILEVLHHFLDR